MSVTRSHFFQSKALLLGVLSSLLFVAFLTGLAPAVLLTFLSPFPLFVAGLQEGYRALLSGVLAACFVTFLFAGIETTTLYLFLIGLPVYLLTFVALKDQVNPDLPQKENQGKNPQADAHKEARETNRVTKTVLVHQLYGLLLLTALFVFFQKVLDRTAIQDLMTSFLSAYQIPHDQKMVEMMYSMLPGGCASSVISLLLLNGVGALQLLKGQGKSLCRPLRLDLLSLPFWPWGALALVGIVSLAYPQGLLGVYARNVLLVLKVIFLLQGLSVAHVFARTKSYGKGFLVSLYVFSFVIDWLGLLIAGLGILEPWVKGRQRLKNQK